ncbi:hypothetical protein Poly41_54510 [Novipirellula artificiosorum]|uniref:DUF3565 domain-containing protein n=2 Tax=Novipirellula artificiosorum TaxID=2528016 RepID=A0A5C6D5P5_9BACT|nr:hypothetical protein Poly41_54510 [Novipirellula artificiosorum]
MQQPIVGYHRDDDAHWVARLACGHNQHVRHDPPWMNRTWVTTAVGRGAMIGYLLDCKKCDEHAAKDDQSRKSEDFELEKRRISIRKPNTRIGLVLLVCLAVLFLIALYLGYRSFDKEAIEKTEIGRIVDGHEQNKAKLGDQIVDGDHSQVFYRSIKIEGVDPMTFRRLKGAFSVDDDHAFLGHAMLAAAARIMS